MGKYTAEMHQAHVEAEEKRKAEEERARKERVAMAAAKREYLAAGGTEAEFEDAWPEIRKEQHRKRALSADERARENMRASDVSRI